MKSDKKILKRINLLEQFAGMILQEATMLKHELSGVVPDNSPHKGLNDKIEKALFKRHKSRLKK